MRQIAQQIQDLRDKLNNMLPFDIDDSPIFISDKQFSIYKDELIIYDEDEEEDYTYEFTISSIGAQGDELYLHETEEDIIVSIYEADSSWRDTYVYIFSKSNRISG